MAEGVAQLSDPGLNETESQFRERYQEMLEDIYDMECKIETLPSETKLPFLSGPVTSGLDEVLKKNKIFTQAYIGRSFVGNHCHRYLRYEVFTDIGNSVVSNTMKATDCDTLHAKAHDISLKFRILNDLYSRVHTSISHKLPLSMTDNTVQDIKDFIKQYMEFFRINFVNTTEKAASVIPKQHILEDQCLGFIEQW